MTHRPFPAPTRPWALQMRWLELCFMHWAADTDALAARLPAGMELDTWEGRAYLGVVPFRMAGVRPRFTVDVPGLSAFPELNLRTYVRVNGVPGVWFFSLDASQPTAVRLARAAFHLPYMDARMWTARRGEVVEYASFRTHTGAAPASFAAAYRPVGQVLRAAPGSLEDWLTARYVLYSADRHGRIFRGDIDHAPWPLRRAEAEIRVNTMAEQIGVPLEGEPHLLYSERLDVRAWLIERVCHTQNGTSQISSSVTSSTTPAEISPMAARDLSREP
ncbi:YqjF family protein [Deinococcus sp.]|uniref:YqjF family protein n=1 Tax=Deinococcus sp. TaxID=47478 RepID=UPI003CC6B726